jgi:glycerol uptake facilitator-like aquaporin
MLNIAIAETLATFFFVSVILATTSVGEVLAPFLIGLALTAGIYFTSKASLGSLNPAVSLALFFRGNIDLPTTLVYIVAEILGALLAFTWWKLTLGAKKK